MGLEIHWPILTTARHWPTARGRGWAPRRRWFGSGRGRCGGGDRDRGSGRGGDGAELDIELGTEAEKAAEEEAKPRPPLSRLLDWTQELLPKPFAAAYPVSMLLFVRV